MIAFDKDLEKLLSAEKKVEAQPQKIKIDFINADFLSIKGLEADNVFLDIEYPPIKPFTKGFDSKELDLQLRRVIRKALKISQGAVVLKLSGDIDYDELPEILDEAMGEDDL